MSEFNSVKYYSGQGYHLAYKLFSIPLSFFSDELANIVTLPEQSANDSFEGFFEVVDGEGNEFAFHVNHETKTVEFAQFVCQLVDVKDLPEGI